jgi:tetratricopeptide (TPR) repeat protein
MTVATHLEALTRRPSRRPLSAALLLALAIGPAAARAEDAKEYPITEAEQRAGSLLDDGRYVRARESAEAILAANPSSFVAMFVMAEVYKEGEGNLPKARFFSRRAQQTLEGRWGRSVPPDGPWQWHAKVLRQLIQIVREMDLQAETIRLIEYRNELYTPKMSRELGWPLMKLGRMNEARERLQPALESDDPETRTGALNTLGAMEDELDHPEESYRIFTALVQEVRDKNLEMDVAFLRNAAEAAWTLLRFDEAEKLLLEATNQFSPTTYSNPWEDLAQLYLGEGRFPEALAAVKEMHAWQHNCQPAMEQQRWAGAMTMTASLLVEVGFVDEALALQRQAIARPDRRAGTSTHADQAEAGQLLELHYGLGLAGARLEERMASAGPLDWVGLWWQRRAVGLERTAARRRAAALIVGHGRVEGSVRVTAPDGISVTEWVRPTLAEILGPGVVGAVAEHLLARTGETAARERPYEQRIAGESRRRLGDSPGAAASLAEAAAALPRAEVLLRARCAALQGMAAAQLGEPTVAVGHYREAYDRHPGILRALDIALPVSVEASGGRAAVLAGSWLAASPRFARRDGGFAIRVVESAGGLEAAFVGPDGAILRQVVVKAETDVRATARSLCDAFHVKVFAPEVDLAQTDIASLEGSTLSGDAMRNQVKELLGK